MTRAHLSLLLPLLAIAACQTERKPLMGYDTQPPGILLDGGNTVVLWPIFDLPPGTEQIFRPRLNGQGAVVTSDEGFYDYDKVYLSGWTGGWNQWIGGVPSGTYTVELVDSAGQSYGQSAPLAISAGDNFQNPPVQLPSVIFTHFDGQTGSWTIDPAMQDSDAATDEITVTNLLGENVVVQRCLIVAGARTSCALVGTVAPGADLHTVETVAGSSMSDHQALFIQLATDASQSYQRDLDHGTGASSPLGGSCQIERIVVHGTRQILPGGSTGSTAFAMSSCYGYSTGAP